MITTTYKGDFQGFAKKLENISKNLQKVLATKLTETAQEARRKVQNDIRLSFDKPTDYTINTVIAIAASSRDIEPTARLLIRDYGSSSNSGSAQFNNARPASKYLIHNIIGGSRALKGFEFTLKSKGILPAGMFAVPAYGAILNANGNISLGQLSEVMNSVQGISTKKTRKESKYVGAKYFVADGYKLHRGIWKQVSKGNIVPVFLFVSSVNYRSIFNFEDSATKAVDSLIDTKLKELIRQSTTPP